MISSDALRAAQKEHRRRLIKSNADLYLLLVPGLLWLVVFRLVPIAGNIIAFQDFSVFRGAFESEWVGFSNFTRLFLSSGFLQALRNSILISFLMIILVTPLPPIVAIMLNEMRSRTVTRSVQTVIFLPHFLSWVIVAGLAVNVLSTNGVVNQVVEAFGGQATPYLLSLDHFRWILVISHGWKNVGYASIVYIAAIAGIDPALYESAIVDGANRFRRIIHITLPGILPTMALLYILRVGNLLIVTREQVLMLYNPVVYEVGDVLGTFVYRVGLGQLEYSFAAAAGLFNSVVSFMLVVGGNQLSKRLLGRSIW